MDCIVHGVAKSRTQLSDFHFTYSNMQGPLYSSWLLHCPLTSQVHPCLSASPMVYFSPSPEVPSLLFSFHMNTMHPQKPE